MSRTMIAMSPDTAFARTLRYDGVRLLILSTCTACGTSKLVSAQDGSLQKWEETHLRDESFQPRPMFTGHRHRANPQ
jgi:hypothetical protein